MPHIDMEFLSPEPRALFCFVSTWPLGNEIPCALQRLPLCVSELAAFFSIGFATGNRGLSFEFFVLCFPPPLLLGEYSFRSIVVVPFWGVSRVS